MSTDVDEEEEHSAEAETGPWEDTHMEDREAKKQLRKEKNRASAAASRARREAYTASLEEEVCHRQLHFCNVRSPQFAQYQGVYSALHLTFCKKLVCVSVCCTLHLCQTP